MSNLWKNKVQDRAQKVITRLLKARNKDGWPVSVTNHINFYALCGCARADNLDFIMTMRVLSAMKKKNLSAVEEFEHTYFDLTNAAKNLKKYQWTSFIPLKLVWPDGVFSKQITLFGITFKFHRLDFAKNKIGKNNLENILKQIKLSTGWKLKELPDCWITCSSSYVDFIQSWRDIAFSLYGLRSLIDLSVSAFRFKHSWPFQPRFYLSFPLYVIGLSKSGQTDFYYFQKGYDESKEKPFVVKQQAWAWIQDNAKRLRKPLRDNSIELLISECLRLYSQSLDDITSNLCFLSFWQMAEAITLSQNFGGKTETVCNRLAWFGRGLKGMDISSLKDALSFIAHNRNEIVHRGRDSDTDQRMIHILQMACNLGLFWLLDNMHSFKTVNDLELYYQCYSKNNAEIHSLENAIRNVKKTRKK